MNHLYESGLTKDNPNEIKQFISDEFGEIRTVVINGEPWFVAKDISDSLGYSETNAMTRRLDSEDFISTKLSGMNMNSTIINESGLYASILGSKLESAKRFKHWVTSEVLPTIRKTGGYVSNEQLFINTYLPFADESTKAMFSTVLMTVRKQNEEIASMKPKANYFDALVDKNLLTNFRDTAKELHVKQSELVNFLLNEKYVYRDYKGQLKPYANYKSEGLFDMKDFNNDSNGYVGNQTMITPKGKETFRLLLEAR